MINKGMNVAVKHYSLLSAFRSTVIDTNENIVTIKVPKDSMRTVFQIGDPLAVAYNEEGSQKIKSATVTGFDAVNELLEFAEKPDVECTERRYSERLPVSLYADFRLTDLRGGKKKFALIRDVSEYGLCITTGEQIFRGQYIDMDIYLARNILSLTAKIVWVSQKGSTYDYGLQIKHNGPLILYRMRELMQKERLEFASIRFD